MELALLPGHPYCVYMHCCDDEIVYIGSGPLTRAVRVDPRWRGKRWADFVASRPVKIFLLGSFKTRQDAYLAEGEHIYHLRPLANVAGKEDMTGIKRGRPVNRYRPGGKRAWVFCENTGDKFYTMRDAAAATGVPLTSISRHCAIAVPFQHKRKTWLFRLVVGPDEPRA